MFFPIIPNYPKKNYAFFSTIVAFAKSCILKVSQDFKTFLRSLARLSRLSRLLKPEKYTMNIV